MWLNLGCGRDVRPEYVNVDRHIPEKVLCRTIDKGSIATIVQCDLSVIPWPWKDSEVEFILAQDIIEHLPDKIATMNELWRILQPKGVVHIVVPTSNGPGAFQDPTHVSYWNENSFKYYEHGNPYRETFADGYGIVAAFKILKYETIQTVDGPKLYIDLGAVK